MDILYFIWRPCTALPPPQYRWNSAIACDLVCLLDNGANSLLFLQGLDGEKSSKVSSTDLPHGPELRFLVQIHLCYLLDSTHCAFLGTETMVLVHVEALPPGGKESQHLNQSKSGETLFPIPGPPRSSKNTSTLFLMYLLLLNWVPRMAGRQDTVLCMTLNLFLSTRLYITLSIT